MRRGDLAKCKWLQELNRYTCPCDYEVRATLCSPRLGLMVSRLSTWMNSTRSSLRPSRMPSTMHSFKIRGAMATVWPTSSPRHCPSAPTRRRFLARCWHWFPPRYVHIQSLSSALTYTPQIFASIDEFHGVRTQKRTFAGDSYKGVYLDNVNLLNKLKDEVPRAYHRIMHTLYKNAWYVHLISKSCLSHGS